MSYYFLWHTQPTQLQFHHVRQRYHVLSGWDGCEQVAHPYTIIASRNQDFLDRAAKERHCDEATCDCRCAFAFTGKAAPAAADDRSECGDAQAVGTMAECEQF
jgi:hypothetical protein